MWSIPEDKALGLDGFNSGFYKAAWKIVGTDVVKAVQDFANGTLLKSWNTTAITLIPKETLTCTGFHISPMQGAFIEGKSILHNILLYYDFHHDMLIALNFPRKFTERVMACVTSTQYSLVINGSPLPTFQAKRGVRQGALMSPFS
ncbi:uncharacterized protein LOC130801031 [Amaranthus tricolor]|uniref:uncharacterized protein LOC130801031 n=1 Tax=Amaranthus tricolor TaxID=29722 RepID=UPI002590079C|nr:uncharacterized protein LOC130801031 [Amaranthus tricolor]